MSTVDHQADHPGCTAVFPWESQCTYWSDPATLIAAARADVRRTDDRHVQAWARAMSGYGKEYGSREEARQQYIALVEGYEDADYANTLSGSRFTHRVAAPKPFSPRRFADNAWALERCDRAITVLVAYGEPIPHGLESELPAGRWTVTPGIGTELWPW